MRLFYCPVLAHNTEGIYSVRLSAGSLWLTVSFSTLPKALESLPRWRHQADSPWGRTR